jgi:putative phosphoesterase
VTRVGVISDTHGLLRPEALKFLAGSQQIIHCGDICEPGVIESLSRIAPVTAVRGNNDKGAWAAGLAQTELIRIGEICVYVIHDLAQLDLDPVAAGVAVVLSGHSHQPHVETRDGIIFLNPGSAGPRRFKLPISAAELLVEGKDVRPRIVEFEPNSRAN